MNPFLERLREQPLLCDGAMGTMLYARGASSAQCLEQLVETRPGWVTSVHQAYAAAGADILTTHTFGASRLRLAKHGLEDKVRDFNFKAVRLVRDVREVSGRSIFIGGNIGPLGVRLALGNGTGQTAIANVFTEQIEALWEAGADFLLFETFSDLAELEVGVRTARSICDLPILASMTYSDDGVTPSGQRPVDVAARLVTAGADVIGVNCSVGPSQMLDTVSAIAESHPKLYISAMPNAGYPTRVEGRLTYPSSPEYFADHVPLLLGRGANVIGGCCGTTPMHIRAMRERLDRHLAGQPHATSALSVISHDDLPEVQAGMSAEVDVEGGAGPTGLLQKLRAGRFVISVEVDPPLAFTAKKQIEGARHAKLVGADAVNVADSPMARVRMGALALCVQIQQQVDIETILHFTTRDRSLMGLQADLIGAHALNVRNVLALTGDPPGLGDNQQSTPVFDVDSIGLVRIIDTFNQGLDVAGREMGRRADFTIAVACDPTRPDLPEEVDRFHQKVTGGAHFTMTQPIYDPQLWIDFLALYEERHGEFPVPVMIGVLPLQSHKHASFLHNEVPGITLSNGALERMRKAGSNGRQEGVTMAQELLLELKELPHVQGVYLMPSFGRYELACQVLEVLTLEERGQVQSA